MIKLQFLALGGAVGGYVIETGRAEPGGEWDEYDLYRALGPYLYGKAD